MDKIIDHPQQGPISLTKIRQLLKENGVFALLVRSADRYFNEYVPKSLSIRAHITGFDGSVGDAIITRDSAHLFVDGRYSLQAQTQAMDFFVHVSENAQSIEGNWLHRLGEIVKPNDVVAYDPHTVDLSLFDRMVEQASKIGAKLKPNAPFIFEQLFGDILTLKPAAKAHVLKVDPQISGQTMTQKISIVADILAKNALDGFVCVKLDDIAWLTNLRGNFFPYQSAIPGIACVLSDKIVLGVSPVICPLIPTDKQLEVVNENAIFQAVNNLAQGKHLVFGIDIRETSKAHEIALRELKIELKHIENPISQLKAIKNEKELLHMRSAFKEADNVVYQTQSFIVDNFDNEEKLSEANVNDYVEEAFKKSGAIDLSFRPICASGKNGAIIHYGTPSNQEILQNGSLFLLDTGAYYSGGYATDLTRTFLAAKSSEIAAPWQKQMFTLVLKASIRGLSARIRRGTLGMQLDALVREPLWKVGLDFAHGTGHGVGINVHEFPPRIGPTSTTPLLEGQIFSIEPGLYFEGLGGVRIENLATVVADPKDARFL